MLPQTSFLRGEIQSLSARLTELDVDLVTVRTSTTGSSRRATTQTNKIQWSSSFTKFCDLSCCDESRRMWSTLSSPKKRSTCMSVCRKCRGNGTSRCWRRTSMRSTVSVHQLEETCSLDVWPVGATGKREGKTRLLNIVMQLRKCCNHPYRK